MSEESGERRQKTDARRQQQNATMRVNGERETNRRASERESDLEDKQQTCKQERGEMSEETTTKCKHERETR